MDIIRSNLPRDGLFVRDQQFLLITGLTSNSLFTYLERRLIRPLERGPGFPMSIGAAIATGKKTVVIHRDGGFMFHATELATAAGIKSP